MLGSRPREKCSNLAWKRVDLLCRQAREIRVQDNLSKFADKLAEGVDFGAGLGLRYSAQKALEPTDFRLEKGRLIFTDKDGNETITGGMTGCEKKTAFVLRQNVDSFFKRHELGRIGFLTLTFGRDVVTPKEANRRFNNWRAAFLGERALEWVKVTEPHKDGRPHFHLLVAFPFEIREGFDFDSFIACQAEYKANGKTAAYQALNRSYVSQAPPGLRDMWAFLRATCKAHGVGRSELLPIRKEGEATTKYVGKYIEKGSVHRTGAWKSARLVSYSQSFGRCANSRFSWVMASSFRLYAAECAVYHKTEYSDMKEVYGSAWAYRIHQCQEAGMTPAECVCILRTMRREDPPQCFQNSHGRARTLEEAYPLQTE